MTTKTSVNKSITLFILLASAYILTGCATIGNNADTDKDLPSSDRFEYLGNVSAGSLAWNWFFQPDEEKRISALKELVRKKAEDSYGKDIILKTERLEALWSPLSLLMLFNTLGFVEDGSIEVSVWREKPRQPAPSPEPEEVKTYGIRYRVIPEQNYMQPSEFVTVEYKTRDELADELEIAHETGKIDDRTLERRTSRLPETGRVFITLGREEIANAITRWFTFSCSNDGRLLFRNRGTEDIPYVYGTDRLWWNDKSYDIDFEWDGELEVAVEDGYQNKVYKFRIVRERYLIE